MGYQKALQRISGFAPAFEFEVHRQSSRISRQEVFWQHESSVCVATAAGVAEIYAANLRIGPGSANESFGKVYERPFGKFLFFKFQISSF